MLTPRRVPALKFSRKSQFLATVWIALVSPMAFTQSSTASGAAVPPAASAMPSPTPSFDVATIKPSAPLEGTLWLGVKEIPNGIDAAYVTLSMLVQRAYGLRTSEQVSGVPKWAMEERFDIQARMSEADIAEMQKLSLPDRSDLRQRMLQTLLAERFNLKVHPETKQVPVYELVVAKGGSKLKAAVPDTDPKLERGEDGKPLSFLQPEGDKTIAQGVSMEFLANFLSQPVWSGLGRPVLDKTGLTGTYDFTLGWSTEILRSLPGGKSSTASVEETGPIFTALKEVGLKLQPATGPLDIIVIDHVERPTAN